MASHIVHVRLSLEHASALEALACSQGKTVSALVRQAVERVYQLPPGAVKSHRPRSDAA